MHGWWTVTCVAVGVLARHAESTTEVGATAVPESTTESGTTAVPRAETISATSGGGQRQRGTLGGSENDFSKTDRSLSSTNKSSLKAARHYLKTQSRRALQTMPPQAKRLSTEVAQALEMLKQLVRI
jgi:hypothetical protein